MIHLKSRCVAFKEWSFVCDALGAGRQSIILRKGGIAEGRGGFQWQAGRFFLFPTHFHEQAEKVRWQPQDPLEATDAAAGIVIRWAAEIDTTAVITSLERAARLSSMHIWRDEVVRDRFGYGKNTGLSLALLRVFRVQQPWILQPSRSFGGCRSWLDLPEHDVEIGPPVLSDTEHAGRRQQLEALLDEAE